MKRFKLIACKVLYREISLLSCRSESMLDVTYLRQGLHNTPEILLKTLQEEINRLDEGTDIYSLERQGNMDFDAILLGYGLCSNAISGLRSKRYKIVVPRAHDCITLFLGSKERYKKYFDDRNGGIYWYTRGWNESCLMPGQERVEALRAEYVEKYGEDNADYLLEMEQGWMKEYSLCAYVDWDDLHSESDVQRTRECARWLGWDFDMIKGDSSLLERFLEGDWNDEDFLVVEPGESITQSFDSAILRSEK